ncbi:hypothetical protein BS47DRAFT_1390104 [Hydnum rufescens UP504]|uniref:Uncharacterized protein n=1 Tax=Hydnum rufescens UP504 TaxID=1448309 RepID=A0A9P6B3Z3_9AGAM|nr:hypothetical protein BS47DRAFT_1390104 [Hydnum rufescens UP504]
MCIPELADSKLAPFSLLCKLHDDLYSPPGQSQNKGFIPVNWIVQLTNEVEALKDQKEELAHEIKNIHEDDSDMAATHVLRFDLILALEVKEVVISHLESPIKHKTNELNIGDPVTAARLEKMKNNNWFSIQLNMCALRDRIVAKIWEHKFEVTNLDCAVHTQAMDHATQEHAKKAITCFSPTITKLISQFNKLQKKLTMWKKPTPHVIIPPPIDSKGSHKLDVDANIWLDLNVDEETVAEFETNQFEDDEGILAAESSNNDSVDSFAGELDRIMEVDLIVGEALDRDALQSGE